MTMLKVHNVLTGVMMEFSPLAHDATSAVSYCWCEEHHRLSDFFFHMHSGRIDDFVSGLPVHYGQRTVACGDWVCRT